MEEPSERVRNLTVIQDQILHSEEFRMAFEDMIREELLFMLSAVMAMSVHTAGAFGVNLDWKVWLDGFAWELKWQRS